MSLPKLIHNPVVRENCHNTSLNQEIWRAYEQPMLQRHIARKGGQGNPYQSSQT